MRVPPVEKPTCTDFAVPLDFMEDDVTWVASKLSGAASALGAEAIDLQNSLLRFGYASEELRVVVAWLADWMANSSPTWAAYHALMACRLVALDERPGVRPVGIRETLCQALAKLVMREAGDQTKTVCVNLQLCAGLEDDIEGATHAVVQGRLERVIRIRQEGEEAGDSMEEEECRGVARLLNILTIETAGAEEEAAEQLEAALGIEVEETDEGKEEGEGTQTALGALEFLTQDAEPSGTTLVDAHNGFNKLRCLAMLRNVRHSWPSGARFTFNS